MDVLLDQVAEFRRLMLFDAADDAATRQRCDIFFEYPTILAIFGFRMAKNSNCRRFFVSDVTIGDFAVTKHQFKTLSFFRFPIHREKIVGNSKKMAEILPKMRKSSDIRIFCHNWASINADGFESHDELASYRGFVLATQQPSSPASRSITTSPASRSTTTSLAGWRPKSFTCHSEPEVKNHREAVFPVHCFEVPFACA